MTQYKLLRVIKSDRKGKKWQAIFENKNTGRTKTTHFGAAGMEDYTQHKDKERRESYRARHGATQSWTDPTAAGTLSRYLLWGDSTNFNENLKKYKAKFNV